DRCQAFPAKEGERIRQSHTAEPVVYHGRDNPGKDTNKYVVILFKCIIDILCINALQHSNRVGRNQGCYNQKSDKPTKGGSAVFIPGQPDGNTDGEQHAKVIKNRGSGSGQKRSCHILAEQPIDPVSKTCKNGCCR